LGSATAAARVGAFGRSAVARLVGFVTDVRYVQLGNGRCRARQASFRTARLDVCYETWSVGMLKVGRVPRDAVAFLVAVGRSGAPRIQGRPMLPGEAVVLQGGEEFDYRSAGPAELLTAFFRRSALEEHVRTLLGRHLGALRLQGRLSRLQAEHAAVRSICRVLVALPTEPSRRGRETLLGRRLERKLVSVLLGGDEAPRKPDDHSPGRALAQRAEVWLRQNLLAPSSIQGLCAALAASERTLHQAFREHLNATPKAYLKTLRLNAARADLMRGEGSTRVTDVALDWGFQHFGWFSQDYRRLFAETPSHTLQRGRMAEDSRLAFGSARSAPGGAGGRWVGAAPLPDELRS
jgi:AraC family transcriptional regulator, ethanolamine operon transcriptional activator